MACVLTISDALRGSMGVSVTGPVSPDALAHWLQLELSPASSGRYGLLGTRAVYDDTAPRCVQQYQIARAACTRALYCMGLLRDVTPHDLAVELCGVTASDPRARKPIREYAPVHHIGLARERRRTGVLQRSGS